MTAGGILVGVFEGADRGGGEGRKVLIVNAAQIQELQTDRQTDAGQLTGPDEDRQRWSVLTSEGEKLSAPCGLLLLQEVKSKAEAPLSCSSFGPATFKQRLNSHLLIPLLMFTCERNEDPPIPYRGSGRVDMVTVCRMERSLHLKPHFSTKQSRL